MLDPTPSPGQFTVAKPNALWHDDHTIIDVDPTYWLNLSAGLRLDHFDANGTDVAALYPERSASRLSPNFSVVVKPLDGIQLFAQYKEGFHAPSCASFTWSCILSR